jgi:hypothetical protein
MPAPAGKHGLAYGGKEPARILLATDARIPLDLLRPRASSRPIRAVAGRGHETMQRLSAVGETTGPIEPPGHAGVSPARVRLLNRSRSKFDRSSNIEHL